MTITEPMTSVVEFLNARLDEDEKLAQECLAEAQEYPGPGKTRYSYPARVARMLHDGRHEPNTTLRDVEAKRLIIHHYERTLDQGWSEADGLAYAVQILAYAYRKHEGYRHEWSPVGQRTQ